MQHEFFHRYTADEHTLVCIEKLDALTTTRGSEADSVSQAVRKTATILSFSISRFCCTTPAKASERDRIPKRARFSRRRVAARLQLSPEQRKSLILLVDHHVTLSNMAQQRNLDDPETVMEFAGIVKTRKISML